MVTYELPALLAAVPIGVAALVKAMLWGKEFANGKSPIAGDGFRETDRERLTNVAQTALRDHTQILNGVTTLGSETKEQTAVLREMRDTLRDVCGVIRTSIPR